MKFSRGFINQMERVRCKFSRVYIAVVRHVHASFEWFLEPISPRDHSITQCLRGKNHTSLYKPVISLVPLYTTATLLVIVSSSNVCDELYRPELFLSIAIIDWDLMLHTREWNDDYGKDDWLHMDKSSRLLVGCAGFFVLLWIAAIWYKKVDVAMRKVDWIYNFSPNILYLRN